MKGYILLGRFKRELYVWHRRLGLVCCIAIITWSLSGICHPLMNWMQPRPVKSSSPLQPITIDQLKLHPEEVLKCHHIERFDSFSIISFSGHTYYRVKLHRTDPALYFDAQDGSLLEGGDLVYAAHLAREYLADRTHAIKSIERLTEFDLEYGKINRLLPVYKVIFDRSDGMRVYVDTDGARLGTLVNDTKGKLAWFFETLHNWAFFGSNERWRHLAALFFASLASFTALSGLLIYGILWRRYSAIGRTNHRGSLQRYHRQLGLIVSIAMFNFATSGWLHALVALREDRTAMKSDGVGAQFEIESLARLIASVSAWRESGPLARISLVEIDGTPYYQFLHADGKLSYVSAKDGRSSVPEAGERYIRQRADFFCKTGDAEIISISPIFHFDDEYGFIFKRIPVFKVRYNDEAHTRCYVDPIDGALAAVFRDGLGSFERWSFTRLHKWHFLNPLGTRLRDLVMIAFALGNVVVALLGVSAFAHRRVFQRKSARG